MSARQNYGPTGRRIVKLKDRDFIGIRDEALEIFNGRADDFRRSLTACLLFAYDSNCFYCGGPTSLMRGGPHTLSKDHVIPKSALDSGDPRARDEPIASPQQLASLSNRELQERMINLVTACEPCNHGAGGKRDMPARDFFVQLAARGTVDHGFIAHQCKTLGIRPPARLNLPEIHP